MDLPITPAAHAQEAGDPLVALNRVALRHDARASRHCDGVARRFLERRLSCDLLRVPSVYLRWSSSRRAASHSSRVAVMRFVIAFVSFLRVPSSLLLTDRGRGENRKRCDIKRFSKPRPECPLSHSRPDFSLGRRVHWNLLKCEHLRDEIQTALCVGSSR
jgi:hypothetical protein